MTGFVRCDYCGRSTRPPDDGQCASCGAPFPLPALMAADPHHIDDRHNWMIDSSWPQEFIRPEMAVKMRAS